LAVGIILLFVGIGIIPTIAQDIEKPFLPTSRGNWLYVGGSGPGNYSTIQSAIDNATDQDIVFVYNDSSPYFEHLNINKSIQLIGEDENTTIIDGSGSGEVISVNADCVTISRFTIRNGDRGITKWDFYRSCVFSWLRVENNRIGIYLIGYISGTIYGNEIAHCTIINSYCGILLGSDYNRIHDNIISNNDDCGIYIYPISGSITSSGSFNHIYNNSIENNGWDSDGDAAAGIVFMGSRFNEVYRNSIVHNPCGIRVEEYCLPGYKPANNNSIVQNNIVDNDVGIEIIARAKFNKIYQNNFIGNRRHASNTDLNFWTDGNGHGNYWDNWIGLRNEAFSSYPKIILGRRAHSSLYFDFIIYTPWVQFDLHPAQEPYDIGG